LSTKERSVQSKWPNWWTWKNKSLIMGWQSVI